jgi:putative NADH-flavin reductase
VREAGAQGHSVVALVRSRTKAADLAGAELVEGDAREEQALSRALECVQTRGSLVNSSLQHLTRESPSFPAIGALCDVSWLFNR